MRQVYGPTEPNMTPNIGSLANVNCNATGRIVTVPCAGMTFASVQWILLTGTAASAVIEARPHIDINTPSSFGTAVTLDRGKLTTGIDVRDAEYLTLEITSAEGGTSTANFWIRLTDDQRS